MSTARRIDPVTQQIVGNALASIADEMATTIFRTAHSTVVRDGMDFSAALCDPTGETVAQGVTVPFHLGSVPHAMSTLLRAMGRADAAGRRLHHERSRSTAASTCRTSSSSSRSSIASC